MGTSSVTVSGHIQLLLLLCGDVELNPGPTLLSRPKLHELDLLEGPDDKIVRVLKDGANRWERIAIRLYFEGGVISEISKDSSDMNQACRTMFVKWLEGDEELRIPRTWETVIKVLKEAGLSQLAESLKAILTEERTPACHNVAISPVPHDSQVMQKFSSKHSLVVPDQTHLTFPLLKNTDMKSEEYEKLKIRLYSESCALMEKFVHLFTSFFQSMSDRQVPIKKIVSNLKTFGAFTPIYKGENQPLLKDELSKLKLETTDMDDVMSTVTDYCSFFNYRLLSFLVEKHGTSEDKEQLEKYEKEFSDYAQRRVFECPSEFGEMNKKFTNLVVKLDDHYEHCTTKQLWLLEADLCIIFGVTNLNLRLLRPGCLQLTFQLPFFVQKAIFPLSKEQEEKLLALHVLRVDCEDYHFSSQGNDRELPDDFQYQPVVCEQQENPLNLSDLRSSTCPSTSTTTSITDIQSFGDETIPSLLSTQHIRREANSFDNSIQSIDEAKPSNSRMMDVRAPVLGLPENLLRNCRREFVSPLLVPTNQRYVLPNFSGYAGQYGNAPLPEAKPVVCEQQEIAVNALLSLKSTSSSSSSTPATTSVASVQTSGDETAPELLSAIQISSKSREKNSNKSRNNVCRICGKGWARPSSLRTHMRTHSGEKPYRCDVCGRPFTQAANLTAHMRTHSGEKPFSCPICQKGFSQSSSVTTHLRTHSGEKPYRCDYCGKAFSDTSTLTKHKRIHRGEKPYRCKICNLGFSQSGNLHRHMKTHNNQSVVSELPVNVLKSAGSSSSTCPSTSTTIATNVQTSEDETTPGHLSTQYKRADASTLLDDTVQKSHIAKTSRSYSPPRPMFGPPQDFNWGESGNVLDNLKQSLEQSLANKTTATEHPSSMSNIMGLPHPPIFSLPKDFSSQGHPEQHISPFMPPNQTSRTLPGLLSYADQHSKARPTKFTVLVNEDN